MVTVLERDLTHDWYNAAVNRCYVGCDIETSGLDRNTDRIATFQMYVPDRGVVMVRRLSANPKNIIRVLEHKFVRKIFHYASFDLSFLMRDYLFLSPESICDTKIAATLIDPKKERYIDPIKQKGSHSLRSLVWNEFGFLMDKSIAVSNWFDNTLTSEQLDYAAKDVEFLPPLLLRFEHELQELGLYDIAQRAFDFLPTKVALDLKVGRDVYSYE